MNTKFEIWKTVQVGGKTKEELLTELTKKDYRVQQYEIAHLRRLPFGTSSTPRTINFVRADISELGFYHMTTMPEIVQRVLALGYKPCEPEDALALRVSIPRIHERLPLTSSEWETGKFMFGGEVITLSPRCMELASKFVGERKEREVDMYLHEILSGRLVMSVPCLPEVDGPADWTAYTLEIGYAGQGVQVTPTEPVQQGWVTKRGSALVFRAE